MTRRPYKKIIPLFFHRRGVFDFLRLLSFVRFFVFLGIFFPISETVFAQITPVTLLPRAQSPLYLTRQWLPDNGLPQISVGDIIQSENGYIWMATFAGLVRYDGVRFQVFNRSSNPEMISDRVVTLCEGANGTIWVGTETGLMKFDGKTFRSIKINGKSLQILKLIRAKNQTIWFLHNDDVGFLKNDSAHVILKNKVILNQDAKLNPFIFDLKNVIQLHENLPPDTLIKLNRRLPINTRDVVQDLRGSWYFASNDSGLFCYKNNQLEELSTATGLPSSFANYLYPDNDGTVWNMNSQNIFHIRGDSIFDVITRPELPEIAFTKLMRDREGSYWVGTQSNGFFRLRESQIETIGREQGMNIENLLSLTFDAAGTLWFSTNCEGVSRFVNGKVENLRSEYELSNNCPWSIMFDRDGNLWVASSGITMFDKNRNKTIFKKEDGLLSNVIFAQTQTADGSLWIGTNAGINRYKNGSFFGPITSEIGLVNNEIRVLFEATDGSMWVGTQNGLSHVSGENIKSFNQIPQLNSHYFRAIAEEANGTMWFGTYGGGIVRLKNGEFRVITTKDGLFDDVVSHLVPDEFGYFWSGSNRGISRISIQELNEVADGKREKLNVLSFGKQEGMANVETNGGFHPSAVKDKSGKIYFPTVSGIAVIDPKTMEFNDVPPPVVIENVVHNSNSIETAGAIDLDYEPFYMEIQYTALSFIDPEKVRFRYLLEGYDNKWIEAGTRRTAFYSNLPPGNFTFKVVASNNNGIWNEEGASILIVIHPPVWMTVWFRVLAVFFIVLVASGIYALRIRSLKKRQKLQEDFALALITSQEQERRRIANELHDGIGQYMMVIKNQLTLLKSLLKHSVDEKQQKVLNETLENSEVVISDLRSIAQDLRPVHLERLGLTETLRNMVAGIITSTNIEINAEIEPIDGLLTKDRDIHVYRLLQEALNNIVKHAGATKVEVNIRPEHDHLVVEVNDNGKGFDTTKKYAGHGLSGMEERTRLLGGSYYMQSVANQGTRLYLYIPIRAEINLEGSNSR